MKLRRAVQFAVNVRRDWRLILERRWPAAHAALVYWHGRIFFAAGRRRYLHAIQHRDTEKTQLRVAVVYVCPTRRNQQLDRGVARFLHTYRRFPPLADHALHVVFNGQVASSSDLALFDGVGAIFHEHTNEGWDIGAFQLVAKKIECDLILCMGTYSYFRRAGWLRRTVEEFDRLGDGLYGASASYEVTPHIRTAGFACNPELIRAYPRNVRTFKQRYEFEHGDLSITNLALFLGLGCWLVTWEGVYGMDEWRVPPQIYRRGDQSNSLYFDRSFDMYEAFDDVLKAEYAALADGLAPSLDDSVRRELLARFAEEREPSLLPEQP